MLWFFIISTSEFFLWINTMKVFWKHGIIYANANVHLNPEQCTALKKWFDFINPLIPSRPIDRIKTNTSEAIYPHLICSLLDEGNECEYNLALINNAVSDMLNLYLTSKGLCWFLLVVIIYKLIVSLVDVVFFGLLFGRDNISLGSHLNHSRLKLMISKSIQELNNYPLRIIPDDSHLVLPTDYVLHFLIPCIVR